MKKLTINQINKRLKEITTSPEGVRQQLTADQYNSIVTTFNKAVGMEAYSKLQPIQQKSLLDQIATQILQMEQSPGMVLTGLSDVKHIDYYDRFLELGEADKLANALSENGVDINKLKSVASGLHMDNEDVGNGITITQIFETDEYGSLVLAYFEVKKDGETIYKFPGGGISGYHKDIAPEDRYEYYSTHYNQEKAKGKKSAYAGTVAMSNGEDIMKWVTKKGNFTYTKEVTIDGVKKSIRVSNPYRR